MPEPKMLTIDLSGQHLLRLGVPDSSLVSEKLVNAIPKAIINPDEAYRLRITPDSILIEATTEKGIYWARQTLAQIVESS
ncbi:MAG: glycoside hydrolase family 20 zincin-like fold domain-containing protein, partial [Proteiniphilum sp.]|nr:glycoside hydrolase family 20 zincin-like fold domain-containing protein [Proteiniphilum sp.]